MDEATRIRKAYARRDSAGKSALYSFFHPAALYMSQRREAAIIDALKDNNIADLSGARILDLGCGAGGVLRDFIKYGANPDNCFGIDLLPDRIEKAARINPNMNLRCGNAEEMACEDSFFDMVLCFTVFSSILDKGMKRNLAAKILRVLKPGGFILWYDYHMDNPKNPDVRGMRKKEIMELFSGCESNFRRITLAPPLTRALAPYSVLLCHILEKIPLLCTHYLGVIRK